VLTTGNTVDTKARTSPGIGRRRVKDTQKVFYRFRLYLKHFHQGRAVFLRRIDGILICGGIPLDETAAL